MTQKTIHLIEVKVIDKYPVDMSYDFEDDLLIVLRGNIVKREIKNNQDGSVDIVMVFKAMDYKIIKNKS